MEKTKSNLTQSKNCVKSLEASKTQPEQKLALWKNVIGDVQLWDRCIDEIQNLKRTVDDLQTQMANAGDISDNS